MKKILFLLALCMLIDTAYGQFRRRRKTSEGNTERSSLNYSNPKVYVVGGIEMEELKVVVKNALVSLSELNVVNKVKVNGDELSGAIIKLWNHGLVGDVTISIDRSACDQI